MMSLQQLEELVAASREPGRLPHVSERLPTVFATARQLLQTIEETGTEDPAQADLQQRLLLCLRVARNAAALGGPPACAALLAHGLLDLVRATLGLVSSAAIALNWQLPAAVAQALANACTACVSAAAAVWAALFPLHLSMLAHVNAGKRAVHEGLLLSKGLGGCRSTVDTMQAAHAPDRRFLILPLQARRRRRRAWRCWRVAAACKAQRLRWQAPRAPR